MAATNHVTIGSQVWVFDPDLAWVAAEVVNIQGSEVVVSNGNAQITVSTSSVFPKDPDATPTGVDDMTKLAYLHEPGVLYNLACRYELNEIYTYTGSILIAVNPFAKLPHLYDISMMEQYKGVQFGELSPHVFAIADQAYRLMMDEGKSQSILVSGESGAGKTETTKLIMQYLAYMGGRAVSDGRTVEQQVLESNPLLEAFGNAKTVRNDNSSRFGKFVEIQFDKNGRISGAAVRTYLLERSRVVQITDPERNYHCFYQLCAGASPEEVAHYKLDKADTFHYLNQSKCIDLNGVSNAREYVKTRRAMDIVGMTLEEQEAIFRVVAAILHLGNVRFSPSSDGEGSQFADAKSKFHSETAAELLRCDPQGLMESLCTRVIITGGDRITKLLDAETAVLNRDALAKTIYSRLFDWLVDKVNKSIGQDSTATTIVGVLDIYGFESFQKNSFEQFCINLANEKLQQHFNQHVFKMEQEEYEKEEINWSYIEFVDNQDVLDLIERKPMGIVALLDEACMFPKSTPATFATKLYSTFDKHRRFTKPKFGTTDFTIDHYAGQVTYQTDLFLDKNKDYVIAEQQAMLGRSECPFVAGLFPSTGDEGSRNAAKFSSLGSRFKTQLQELMATLNLTEPHYIRCVKPNVRNKPGLFENGNVLHQLRCGGVLEAVRISCAGYPTRRTFYEFLDRFGMLAPDLWDEGAEDEKVVVERLLQRMGLSNYQVGLSKVFLRAGQMAELDGRRTEILNIAATRIQRAVRTFLWRRQFIAQKKAAITIQRYWRGYMARQEYQHIREDNAAVVIQKHVRRWQIQQEYIQLRRAALVIQAGTRGMFARKEYRHLKETKAAIKIQTAWRGYAARKSYKKLRKAAITFQCAWRARIARKELRKLKLAARETGALQAAKSKLEKQCEELTWRLQLEKRMRTDLEEAKNQEISKLTAALTEARELATTAKGDLVKERENLKEAIATAQTAAAAAAPVVTVNAAVNEQMIAENKKLHVLVEELQKQLAVSEAKVLEAKRMAEESAKKASDAEAKILQMQNSMSRMEEQISEMGSENQVLRQQTLAMTPTKGITTRLVPTIFQRHPTGVEEVSTPVANGTLPLQDSPGEAESRHTELEQKRQKLLIDRQQNDQDALLMCIVQDVGFSSDRPIAACIIFKCLLSWRSFEAERTNVFDRIIQTVGTAIESQDNNDVLGYWLSNTAMLLFLLQRTLKAGGAGGAGAGSMRRRAGSSVTLFGRMTQGFRSSPSVNNNTVQFNSPSERSPSFSNGGSPGGFDSQRQVEAKYPALLFKQQLTAYVEKIYGMIRDNLKKEITPMLGSCIQAPRASRATMGKGHMRSPSAVGQQPPLSSHWGSIITSLSRLLNTMRANRVPPFLVRKLFTQIFSFINVQLFNSLLLRRECCSFSNGEYVKAGLAELEHWIHEASQEYAGSSWEELKYIRQAVGFLVIHQKPKKSLDEITHDLCPVLSVQQLYRISTMYWDDKYGTHSVSPEVISNMRVLMTEDSNDAVSNSFLLDDDSSIPFSVEDISKSMPDIDLADVESPPLLKENPSFQFLTSHAE